ncbi:MAG: hypothetical protein LKE45_10710 [Olsenella sp.]|nr:hypothetical protein [Olsenella sp.]
MAITTSMSGRLRPFSQLETACRVTPRTLGELLLSETGLRAHGLDLLAKFHRFFSLPGPSIIRAKTARKKA